MNRLDYDCQVLYTQGRRHLRVQRVDRGSGIPWEDLQELKNELLGTDVVAVELYPAANNVIDECNMRHLWELHPEENTIGWRTNT